MVITFDDGHRGNFALKDPSLLGFDQRRAKPENLRGVFGIKNIPSDTQMRTILDEVNPDPLYKKVFQELQRGKVLEKMTFMGKYYLASINGTGYFSSKKCIVMRVYSPRRSGQARSYTRIKCWV